MPAKHPDERRGPMDEREDGAPDVEDADCDFCGETDLPVAVSEHADENGVRICQECAVWGIEQLRLARRRRKS